MRLKLAIAAIALAAVGVWLLVDLGSDDKDPSGEPAYPRYEVYLSEGQVAMLKATALKDPTVQGIAGEGDLSIASIFPWTDEGGTELVGAVVELAFTPPARLVDERLPVLFTPGPNAPAGTPDLHRTVVLSASNVSGLETLIELDGRRVVQVVPARQAAKVASARLLGPPVGDAYEGEVD